MIFGNLRNHRRYALARWASLREALDSMADVWHAAHRDSAGTPLPADFPYRSALVTFGYDCVEDLEGATSAELVENLGLQTKQADSVIAAYAAEVTP